MRFCETLTPKNRQGARVEGAPRNAASLYLQCTAPLEANALLIEKFIISHRLKEAQGSWRGVISHQSGFEELR